MEVVVLRFLCKGLSRFENQTLDVEFVTEKRVYSDEVESGTVELLFGHIYKLNSLAFAGINATGKTTVLNLLSELLQLFLGNISLTKDMKLASFFESKLSLESYFYQKDTKKLFKLCSTIEKDPATKELFFSQEVLLSKKASSSISRDALFDYDESMVELNRSTIENSFLKGGDSIFSSIMNKYKNLGMSVHDLCRTTNHNLISNIAVGLLVPFAQYLDPSIENIVIKKEPKDTSTPIVFEIKFRHYKDPIFARIQDLELYLSSGTIKGLSCLSAIAVSFIFGGYVIIDEIENHLNKTIVINMIELFSSKVNNNNATLLFSTHYSEILDSIDRSDSIYLFDKKDSISLDKYSHLANEKDRSDKKRSDLILSGLINSAPSYSAYRTLIDKLSSQLSKQD